MKKILFAIICAVASITATAQENKIAVNAGFLFPSTLNATVGYERSFTYGNAVGEMVPGPEGDVDAALRAIEAYCLEAGQLPVISMVPEHLAAKVLSRYPYVRVSDIRTWRDYVYYREDLQYFTGRRYSGQRNHIKKFRAQWPDAEVRPLTAEEIEGNRKSAQGYLKTAEAHRRG